MSASDPKRTLRFQDVAGGRCAAVTGQSVGTQSALNSFGVPLDDSLAGAKGHGLQTRPNTASCRRRPSACLTSVAMLAADVLTFLDPDNDWNALYCGNGAGTRAN